MQFNRALALVCALGLMMACVSSALAHAKLDQCVPTVNGTVTQAPANVKCVFDDELDGAQSALAVYDASGAQVDNKDSKLDATDTKNMTIIVTVNTAKLPNGVYTVKWNATAKEDGGKTAGEWKFGIGVTLPQTGAAAVTDWSPVWWLALSGVLLLGVSRVMRRTV